MSEEKTWEKIIQPEYTDIEVIDLYSKEILSSVDQKALDEVAKFSTESVVLIAISPVAIIDMMLMFWRNLRMIDKVAGLYGLKLGYWSRIRLIKHVFINMAYAGASEIIADFGADLLGADLLGKLSGRMAQGLGAGMLTARLGIKTISLCRPIPFQNQPPKLNDIRKKIIIQIKGLLKPS
jgi:putative membrane protein